MYRSWWQLPGPSGFISTITEDLRDGLNVLCYLPKHVPSGILKAIRTALGLSDRLAWYPLRATAQNPLDLMFDHFGDHSRGLRNVSTLSTDPEFAGKVIWLENITSENWERWKEFFASYAQACQHVPIENRGRFCIPLPGELVASRFDENPLWSQYRWADVVSHLDMVLFASTLLQDRPMPPLQRSLAVEVIATLALWDPEVCESLAKLEISELLQPLPVLAEIGRERGWDRTNHQTGWIVGLNDYVDGRWLRHSAAIALEDSPKEIFKRIWSAEVSVLLPIVEEVRQAVLAKYGDKLILPMRTRFGEIHDLYELEINHIYAQIFTHQLVVDSRTSKLVKQMTTIRNLLAHLKTVPPQLFESKVLNEFVVSQFLTDSKQIDREFNANDLPVGIKET